MAFFVEELFSGSQCQANVDSGEHGILLEPGKLRTHRGLSIEVSVFPIPQTNISVMEAMTIV